MNYSISTGHHKTAEAAENVLLAGGNAVDAAIAALTTSFVAEPCMSGAGAGGFAMVRAPDGNAQLYDFFCQAPRKKRSPHETEFRPIVVDFGSAREIFYTGKGAIAVPGTVHGIFTMHDMWGHMPIKEIFKPAIHHAKEGVEITAFQRYYISLLREILASHPIGRRIYFNGEQLKDSGEILKMPDLADLLETMAVEGCDLYYRGEIAKTVVEDVDTYGHLSIDDFKSYKTYIKKPLKKRWNDWLWYSNPEPSMGGAMQWCILSGLSDLPTYGWKQVRDVLKSSEQLRSNPEKLFKRYFGRTYGHGNDMLRNRKYGSTTHFNVIDEGGLGVSLTVSIGEGSGYFIPGTDVQLNNCLGESALLPGGLHSWLPDQRLISLMSPTVLQHRSKDTFALLGTGGAGRIPSAMSHVILRYASGEKLLPEAVNSPRAHWQEGVFNVEKGYFDDETMELLGSLKDVTVWSEPHLYFGGVQASSYSSGRMDAVSDSRREGTALYSNI